MRTILHCDIVCTLDLLCISPGDTLLVHSALSAIGHIEGGADTVINAIIDYLGTEGTLVMSALSGADAPFDPKTTPTSLGKLSETFRRRASVLRSWYPVQSVCAIGKHAEYITADHEKCTSGYGEGSPYSKIRDLGGKILLIGVDQDRNTFLHVIEDFADSSYLTTMDVPAPVYIPEVKTFTLTKLPLGHRDFTSIMPELRKEGLIEEAKLGNAVVRCMPMQPLFVWAVDKLKQDPFYFLCHNKNCRFCFPVRNGLLDRIVYE